MLNHISIKFIIPLLLSFNVHANISLLNGGIPDKTDSIVIKQFGYGLIANSEHKKLMDCIDSSLFKNGIVVKWKEYPVGELFKNVEEGKIDVGFPLTFSTARDLLAIKSNTILYSKDVMVYDAKLPSYRDSNLIVGARSGTVQYYYLSNMRYKEFVITRDYSTLVDLLNEGKVSIIALSNESLKAVEKEIKIPVKYYFYNETSIGFYFSKKTNKTVVDNFNEVILKCK